MVMLCTNPLEKKINLLIQEFWLKQRIQWSWVFLFFKHFMEHPARKHLIRYSLTIRSVVWFIVTKLGKCQFTFTLPPIPSDAQTFTKALYKDRIHSLLTSLNSTNCWRWVWHYKLGPSVELDPSNVEQEFQSYCHLES